MVIDVNSFIKYIKNHSHYNHEIVGRTNYLQVFVTIFEKNTGLCKRILEKGIEGGSVIRGEIRSELEKVVGIKKRMTKKTYTAITTLTKLLNKYHENYN
jgi:hypothetical protein